ncbi:cysteine--tRNA ligase [Candidatus Pacebacteria bacterium]|nr:cysteine--tRNA ligase [Candidatus Paceibacterota bacterium]
MFKLFSSTSSADYDLPPLQFFNSESRQLEIFEPHKTEVRMYTCGPTVYDFVQIGNLRAFLMADIAKRTLLYNGYQVRHVMNFTDFGHLSDDADAGEDKMMKGLAREGMEVSLQNMKLLSERYIESFKDDAAALNILEPTKYTKASDYVKAQIKLIQTLDEKGYTYATSDGLYFDISKFATYGRLGNIQVDAQENGARVAVNPEKKHPADFAVWKNGELGWSSPWGNGFPGWHIECSAMAITELGKQIDIHTGGIDLIPTHHNGEIAQSECATGKQFVKYWLHNEFLNIAGEKISKSKGNSIYLNTLQERGYSGTDYRYWLLTSHYRTNTDFTYEALDGAKQALSRLKRFVYEDCTDTSGKIEHEYRQRFAAAINEDMDTPKAIANLWAMMKDDAVSDRDKRATMMEMDQVLGLELNLDPKDGAHELGYLRAPDIPEDIQQLIDEREAARVARNWAEADKLRDALSLKGYTIEDSAEGPKVTQTH